MKKFSIFAVCLCMLSAGVHGQGTDIAMPWEYVSPWIAHLPWSQSLTSSIYFHNMSDRHATVRIVATDMFARIVIFEEEQQIFPGMTIRIDAANLEPDQWQGVLHISSTEQLSGFTIIYVTNANGALPFAHIPWKYKPRKPFSRAPSK